LECKDKAKKQALKVVEDIFAGALEDVLDQDFPGGERRARSRNIGPFEFGEKGFYRPGRTEINGHTKPGSKTLWREKTNRIL